LKEICRGLKIITPPFWKRRKKLHFFTKSLREAQTTHTAFLVPERLQVDHAAELAGVPDEVVLRAKEILFDLECGNTINVEVNRQSGKRSKGTERALAQLSLFNGVGHPAIEMLKKLDLTNLTPLQAMNILDELVKLCR
jgi:hypothetical protein